MFFGNTEEFSHEFGAVTEIFLNKFGTDDTQESSRCLVSDGFGEEGFACSWDAVEDDTLWRFDTHFFV